MGIRVRIGAATVLVVAAALLAGIASRPPHSSAATARIACGVERWTVKTLGDRPSLVPSRPTSIAALAGLAAPASLPATRLPIERQIFRVTAAVTLVRAEDDGDLHLVLQDRAGRTMIAESPAGSCGRAATAHRQVQMAAARTHVRLCAVATVVGVAFFDFLHGQTGVAPNGIELHPVLGFHCATAPAARAKRPPSTTRTGKARLVSVTSPVGAGSDATAVVAVPSGTSCSIVVTYKSGPSSAAGLYAQRARAARISWTWMVGTRTTPGRWPIDVSCGAAGSLHTSFVVT